MQGLLFNTTEVHALFTDDGMLNAQPETINKILTLDVPAEVGKIDCAIGALEIIEVAQSSEPGTSPGLLLDLKSLVCLLPVLVAAAKLGDARRKADRKILISTTGTGHAQRATRYHRGRHELLPSPTSGPQRGRGNTPS